MCGYFSNYLGMRTTRFVCVEPCESHSSSGMIGLNGNYLLQLAVFDFSRKVK